MATKKTAGKTKKPVAKKPAAKTAKKKVAKKVSKKVAKGSKYECEVCGLVVSVNETCGCVETCDIICCGEQMKTKK